MTLTIDDLLRHAVDHGASDVHLKVGSAPVIRIDGELRPLPDTEPLTPGDTEAYAEAMFSAKASTDFAEKGVADFAYGRQDLGRFRVTTFRQRGSVSLVMRRVVAGSKTFAELGLPRIIEKAASAKAGLVLVTGSSGSGKTTTVSSIVDWINSNRSMAIITIEDPIEVLHPDKRSVVAQREVGVDTPDVATAVRSAMRHDADVIMISEISDAETAKAAIDAAETGHLVISTMRTTEPAETVTRLVSMFSEAQRPVVRNQLANQIQAIISQVLVDNTHGGRVMACEVLTSNERAKEWLVNGEDASALVDIIKESGFHGMQTFDQALLKHVVERTVEIGAVLAHVRNTHEIRAKAMAAGIAS